MILWESQPTKDNFPMFEKKDLLALANEHMPFGKYQGRILIDVPEEYLLWFAKKGMPEGRLGMLLSLALEIKMNGLESIIEPLKKKNASQFIVNESLTRH
ncbi:MAG: hypothetical protein ACI9EX_001676 [Oleispira sp.]